MSNPKSILNRLIVEEQLVKTAQVTTVVNEGDITKATEEIFDQTFEEVMSELGIK